MVDPAPRTPRTADDAVAVGGVVVSTANVLGFQLFASLSVPVNMVAYLVANGAPPPKADGAGDSVHAQWAGHLGFVVPWWYFAASGLVTLLVVLLAANPRWRFEAKNSKYFAYRTTPGFLAFISAIMAGSQFAISTYYVDWTEKFGTYAIGTILSLIAVVIAFILYKTGPKSAGPSRGRRAAERTA